MSGMRWYSGAALFLVIWPVVAWVTWPLLGACATSGGSRSR